MHSTRFLEGNYAPVTTEVTATDLPVTGQIPDFVDGRYLRIGPNPIEPNHARYQWFTGSGMVHGIRIADGRAHWYRNRWVRSAAVSRSLRERPRRGPRLSGMDFASNTNILEHAGRTLAVAEMGTRPYELTHDLDTVAPSDFDGTLRGGYTGHPKKDPLTGELHAVSYNPMWGNAIRYTVTGIDGRVRTSRTIPMPANTMMHDFSLTEKYIVLYDLPVVLDLSALAHSRFGQRVASMFTGVASRHALPDAVSRTLMLGSGLAQPDVGVPYRWNDGHNAQVVVIERNGRGIRRFDVEPCFVYHTLNAYDCEIGIVMELARHPRAFDGDSDPLPSSPTLDRWTVDFSSGTVRSERLDDRSQDFPRIDERAQGRRHRYGYTIASTQSADRGQVPTALLQHDMHTGSVVTREFGAGTEPGEFVHVPRTPDGPEDDAIVMGPVYDASTDRTDLMLLDAATLDVVATIHLPVRIPHGFHGNFEPSSG
ncbi:carotenoid oxygenase family protein [Rhodococcus sp. 077-4]|uniref:carotenoid oxygenase family protein n=1 Tax=Rhodococcus sp. 077-4 TaxID=2789271 RepID=UPI0039F55F2C